MPQAILSSRPSEARAGTQSQDAQVSRWAWLALQFNSEKTPVAPSLIYSIPSGVARLGGGKAASSALRSSASSTRSAAAALALTCSGLLDFGMATTCL